jgi:hypothetical protein
MQWVRSTCIALVCFLLGAGCSDSHNNICACPAIITPRVDVALPCGESSATLSVVSGNCSKLEGELAFTADEPGTCKVTVDLPDGSRFTRDVIFTGEWRPCGSEPRGCGQQINAKGLEGQFGESVLQVGAACTKSDDAGT